DDFAFLKKHTQIHSLLQSDFRVTEALCVLGVFVMPFVHGPTGSSAMLNNVSAIGQYAICINNSDTTKTSWFSMTDGKIKPAVCFRVQWKKLLLYHFDETHGGLVINGIDTRTLTV